MAQDPTRSDVKIEVERSEESGQTSGSTPAPPSAPQTQNQILEKTPYHYAAHKCDFGRVKRLEGTKFDIEQRDDLGANCLDSVVRTKLDEKFEKNFEKIKKTFKALLPQKMDGKLVKAMLENEDEHKHSAMGQAAFWGKRRTLSLLLDRFVDVTSSSSPAPSVQAGAAQYPITSMGRTLLHSAASSGRTETAKDLLHRWPKMIDVKDSDGCTALHIAAKYKHASFAVLLIQHKASLSALDNRGEPAAFSVMFEIKAAKEGVLKRLDQSLSFEKSAKGSYKKRHKIKIDLNSTILNVDEKLPESYVLSRIAELDPESAGKFLLHPVCKTFVELKLQRLRAFCSINILLYFTFLGLFTALCVQSGVVARSFSNHTREKDDYITMGKDDNIALSIGDGHSVLSKVTTAFASLCVLRSPFFVLFYISSLWKKREPLNLKSSVPMRDFNTKGIGKIWWGLFGEIVEIAVFAWTISVIWSSDTYFVEHSVAFLFLIFWCKSVFLFEVFPSRGKCIIILKAVLLTFSKFFNIFIPLRVVVFGAFSVIFKGTFSFSKNLPTMLSMMLEEYDEKKIFSNFEKYLPITGPITFVLFILVLSVVHHIYDRLSANEILLAKSNIERLRLAEELAFFVKKTFCGLAVFWKQMQVFSHENYGIVHVSIKKPDTNDLLSNNPKSKSKRTIQEYGAYALFHFGIVLSNTSLYRKYPIGAELQNQLESVALINSEK